MFPDSALSAIHTAFAQPVTWQQQGETDVTCTAIVFHGGESEFSTVRRRGYEVPVADLPFKPKNGDLVIDGGTAWRVIEVIDYDEASAWRVFVDRRP
jgi:hypothetical protein